MSNFDTYLFKAQQEYDEGWREVVGGGLLTLTLLMPNVFSNKQSPVNTASISNSKQVEINVPKRYAADKTLQNIISSQDGAIQVQVDKNADKPELNQQDGKWILTVDQPKSEEEIKSDFLDAFNKNKQNNNNNLFNKYIGRF